MDLKNLHSNYDGVLCRLTDLKKFVQNLDPTFTLSIYNASSTHWKPDILCKLLYIFYLVDLFVSIHFSPTADLSLPLAHSLQPRADDITVFTSCLCSVAPGRAHCAAPTRVPMFVSAITTSDKGEHLYNATGMRVVSRIPKIPYPQAGPTPQAATPPAVGLAPLVVAFETHRILDWQLTTGLESQPFFSYAPASDRLNRSLRGSVTAITPGAKLHTGFGLSLTHVGELINNLITGFGIELFTSFALGSGHLIRSLRGSVTVITPGATLYTGIVTCVGEIIKIIVVKIFVNGWFILCCLLPCSKEQILVRTTSEINYNYGY